MSKQLATAIHLTDDSGVVYSFLPGSTPPKWARKRITNPKAWADNGEPSEDAPDEETPETEAETGSEPDDSSPSETAGSETDESAGDNGEPSEDAPATEIPKRNASTKVWAAYAASHGFETDDDVSRAEIIAALEANGIATA